jgi:hypothetical protein
MNGGVNTIGPSRRPIWLEVFKPFIPFLRNREVLERRGVWGE